MAFAALKDVCINFESALHRGSSELCTAKIEENFENVIAKKMQDLALLKSKMRLLQAKPLSLELDTFEQDKDPQTVLLDYEEAAMVKIIEELTVKSITQGQAVKALLSTPVTELSPELVERREKILSRLMKYRNLETTYQQLDMLLGQKHEELAEVRTQWDTAVCELRDLRNNSIHQDPIDNGPLYKKLKRNVQKIQLLQWTITKLVMPRTRGYDWLVDPHRRLDMLKSSRAPCTVDKFLEEDENDGTTVHLSH